MDVLKFKHVVESVVSSFKQIKGPKEDLVQECYLALLEVEWPETNEEKFAEKTCRARLNQIQSKSRTPITDSLDDPRTFSRVARIPETGGLVTEHQLNEAVCDLPYEEYQVIHGVFYEGQTEEKTAHDLSITKRAVQWRKQKGIRKLKKHFEVE